MQLLEAPVTGMNAMFRRFASVRIAQLRGYPLPKKFLPVFGASRLTPLDRLLCCPGAASFGRWVNYMKLRFVGLTGGLVAGAVVLSLQSSAHADTFTYSSYTVPGEQTISITSPSNVYGGMGQIVLAGSAPSSAGITIMAWCLDVYTYLLGDGYGGSGPFTYNVSLLTPATTAIGFGTSDATLASESGLLTSTQIAQIGGLIAYGNANISTANVSAATQLAIWETEYGNLFSFTGVSTATQNQAATEIADLGTSIVSTQMLRCSQQSTVREPDFGV